jgi:hypothetical protein
MHANTLPRAGIDLRRSKREYKSLYTWPAPPLDQIRQAAILQGRQKPGAVGKTAVTWRRMDSAHPVTGELAPSHGYGFLGLRTHDDRSEVERYREAATRIDCGEGHNSVLYFMGLEKKKLARFVALMSIFSWAYINLFDRCYAGFEAPWRIIEQSLQVAVRK